MKFPDKDPLLKEILEDEKLAGFRRTALDRALEAMRRARRARRATRMRMLVLLPVLTLLLLSLPKLAQKPAGPASHAHPRQTMTVASAPVKEPGVKVISDEELFALFPDRPVALIGRPGHQKLVLLDTPARN